ncbi:MAG: hypothetical protein AB7G25_00095 [Sphingomonadaceae bacterium]
MAGREIMAPLCISAVINVLNDTLYRLGATFGHDNLFFDGLWMIEDHHEQMDNNDLGAHQA